MEVELVYPNTALVSSYLSCMQEMQKIGEKIWERTVPMGTESPEQFVGRQLRGATQPDAGLVPETHYWGLVNGEVVGRIALRHFLNENLKKFGGHIGYEVRPSARKQGVATAMLRELLKTARAKEIGRLLLTCAPENEGSNKTILNNGGVLEKTEYSAQAARPTNYYWITL